MKRKRESEVLKIKAIPVPKSYIHPGPPNIALPKHEFTMGIIAPVGCGKTTTICNILQFYAKKDPYFHSILVFSPTIESDEKWDVIKKIKLISPNLPLKAFIQEMIYKEKNKKRKGLVERPVGNESELQPIVDSIDACTGYIPEDCFFDDYSDEVFESLMKEQLGMINMLKHEDKPKYLANRVLIILDDLVGSALFSSKYFKGFITRHRHHSASVIMVSQGYKEIPKTIRTNWMALMVFEIGNDMEVQVIFEEYSMCIRTFKQWSEMYRYCTNEEFAFMFINRQRKKRERIMKNFEEYVNVTQEVLPVTIIPEVLPKIK